MDNVAIVCAVVLAVGSVWPGWQLARLDGPLWDLLRSRGITQNLARGIGIAQLVGAVGVIAGLFLAVIGLIATLVLALVFIWAVGQRVVYGDYGNPDMQKSALFPLGMLVLCVITGSIFVAVSA